MTSRGVDAWRRRDGLYHAAPPGSADVPPGHALSTPTRRRGTPLDVSKQRSSIIADCVGVTRHLNFSSQFCVDVRTAIEANRLACGSTE